MWQITSRLSGGVASAPIEREDRRSVTTSVWIVRRNRRGVTNSVRMVRHGRISVANLAPIEWRNRRSVTNSAPIERLGCIIVTISVRDRSGVANTIPFEWRGRRGVASSFPIERLDRRSQYAAHVWLPVKPSPLSPKPTNPTRSDRALYLYPPVSYTHLTLPTNREV